MYIFSHCLASDDDRARFIYNMVQSKYLHIEKLLSPCGHIDYQPELLNIL